MINRDIEKVSTFNFGPADLKTFNVLEIAKILISTFDKNIDELIEIENPKYYESDYLQLDSTKANKVLKWNPLFDIEKSINSTSEWYKDYYSSNKPKEISIKHLKEYIKLLNI